MNKLINRVVIADDGARAHPPALVRLNEDQARRRDHLLELVKADKDADGNFLGGVFEVTGAVFFKRGEVIGIDPELVSARQFAPGETEAAEATAAEVAADKRDADKKRDDAKKKKTAADRKRAAAAKKPSPPKKRAKQKKKAA